MFGKIVAGLFGGLIVAIIGAMVVTVALASSPAASSVGAIAFFVFWALGIALAVTASRTGKAWRRVLISSGLLSFALPLSSIIFTGSVMTQAAGEGGEFSGAAAAGAAIGGGMITIASGVLGFFLGVIFLVIGLLVGRDREVIIIREGGIEQSEEQIS